MRGGFRRDGNGGCISGARRYARDPGGSVRARARSSSSVGAQRYSAPAGSPGSRRRNLKLWTAERIETSLETARTSARATLERGDGMDWVETARTIDEALGAGAEVVTSS